MLTIPNKNHPPLASLMTENAQPMDNIKSLDMKVNNHIKGTISTYDQTPKSKFQQGTF